MNIYVAAPWIHKQDAIEVANIFRGYGHTITSHWFDHEGDPNDSSGSSSPDEHIRAQALEDIRDVLAADVVVVLNLAKSEGKAVETGIAIANRIPVISVGKRSNIFQVLGPEVENVTAALALLKQLGTLSR